MKPTLAVATKLIITVAVVFHTITVLAQGPPPAAPAPSEPQTAKTNVGTSQSAAETFTSLEGRFSIALPQLHGVRGLTISTPFGTAKGDAYFWRLDQGSFIAGHADAPVPVDSPETAPKVFASLREEIKKIATANNGNLREDKLLQLGKYRGVEQRVDLFSGFIVQRTYLVSRRLYQVSMILRTDQREYETAALKILDSFKVMDEPEVSARLDEEAKKAEPAPLPQEPGVQRAGTDATDDYMRGPVKTVLEESQDLSGTWSVQTRKRDSFVQYNQQGNRVRRESYDYKGNLYDITVYGFIDGSRVSTSKTVTREYNPPPVVGGPVVKKSDPRYQTKYEFKYDEQKRLIEHRWFHSNGDLFLRYVYNYKGNQLEELVYSEDGSLNQRYLFNLDAKGNEIDRTGFDTRDNKPGSTSFFTYELDSHGNWIKRTTSKQVNKDGKVQTEPQYVDFRTITYW